MTSTALKSKRGRPRSNSKGDDGVRYVDRHKLTRELATRLATMVNQYWHARGVAAGARLELLALPRPGCVAEYAVRSDLGRQLTVRPPK